MSPKHRMYSIPFNGMNPEWFLQEVEKRKHHIDHVYCELPYSEREMLSHVRFLFDGQDGANANMHDANSRRILYIRNCYNFLRISKGRVRRICPINAVYYKFNNEDEFQRFVRTLAQLARDFELEGMILSDYRIAEVLHALMPELELHTSCNVYQWNLRQMSLWQERCGIKTFNPPREILRTPSKLKEMHDAGFKLKCLINEGCLMGCPNSFYHNMSVSLRCYGGIFNCCQSGVGDIFRGNWILPRWQKYYDKYVDIYKISGRNEPGDYAFRTMDAFLAENNDKPLTDVMISGTISFMRQMLPEEILRKITLDKVPDKLLSCECKECRKCGLCQKLAEKLIPEKYRGRFNFKIKVVKSRH